MSIKVVEGLELGEAKMVEELEGALRGSLWGLPGSKRYYRGQDTEWERTPKGNERYETEHERDKDGYYEERDFGKIKMKIPTF